MSFHHFIAITFIGLLASTRSTCAHNKDIANINKDIEITKLMWLGLINARIGFLFILKINWILRHKRLRNFKIRFCRFKNLKVYFDAYLGYDNHQLSWNIYLRSCCCCTPCLRNKLRFNNSHLEFTESPQMRPHPILL